MIWSLILILLSTPGFSMLGRGTTFDGSDSTCRIIIRSGSKLSAICSAVLISPGRIMTANHCSLRQGETADVQCGFKGQSGRKIVEKTNKGTSVVTSGVSFKETRKNIRIVSPLGPFNGRSNSDGAYINISPHMTSIRPARPVMNPTRFFYTKNNRFYLRPDVECKTEGFGLDANGVAGILHSGLSNDPMILAMEALGDTAE